MEKLGCLLLLLLLVIHVGSVTAQLSISWTICAVSLCVCVCVCDPVEHVAIRNATYEKEMCARFCCQHCSFPSVQHQPCRCHLSEAI